MWFGVAPSPAPSLSRTNTQAWHPPHCTCARHRKIPAASQAHELQQSQRQRDHHALSPRAHMLSPRKQVSGAFPLTSRDDRIQPAIAVGVAGPMSPRAHRRQREQPVRVTRKAHDEPAIDAFLGSAGSTTFSKRGGDTALRDSSNHASASIRPSTKATRRDATDEPALIDDKQPQEDDALSVDSNNDFSYARDEYDGNNSVMSGALPDEVAVEERKDVAVERRALRSGRRVSRVAAYVQNAVRPPTVYLDSSGSHHRLDPISSTQALPAPPKSRRSSRNYTAFTYADTSEQSSPREHASRFQPENLVGHTSSVCSIVTADDRYLVSCSIDGSVKVWSRASFRCLHTLFGHEDNVSCVDVNARWLVSGSHDTTLRVYSCLESFKLLHVLRGHAAHVTKVHLPLALPHQILSCSDDSTIRVWNGEWGHCVFVLQDHSSRITCFYTEGARICSGSADAAICFWDLATVTDRCRNREIRAAKAFRVHKATVQVLVANSSIDGTLILSGSNDGTIQIFNFQTLEYAGCLDHVHSPIYSMCLLSSSQLICSTSDGRLLHFSDLYSHPLVKSELRLADKWISMLQSRGSTIVCSSEDLLYVVDAEQMRVHAVIETMHGFINSVGWLHSTALISGGQDNVVKIWNIG